MRRNACFLAQTHSCFCGSLFSQGQRPPPNLKQGHASPADSHRAHASLTAETAPTGSQIPYLAPFYAQYHGPHRATVPFNRVLLEVLRRLRSGHPPPAPFSLGCAENLNVFFFAPKPYNYIMQVMVA